MSRFIIWRFGSASSAPSRGASGLLEPCRFEKTCQTQLYRDCYMLYHYCCTLYHYCCMLYRYCCMLYHYCYMLYHYYFMHVTWSAGLPGKLGRSSVEGRLGMLTSPPPKGLGPLGRSVFFTLDPGRFSSKAKSPTFMNPRGLFLTAFSAAPFTSGLPASAPGSCTSSSEVSRAIVVTAVFQKDLQFQQFFCDGCLFCQMKPLI